MEKLIEYIINNNNKVIGLDGPCGAGKSTISKFLESNFDVLVFHTDDYFLSTERKTDERLAEPGGNIDYERMIKEIFEHLEDDKIFSNKFNCKYNKLVRRNSFERKSIILIEGVYSLHPKFRDYYDFSVFLDIDKKTQYSRILERSGAVMLDRYIKEWIPLEENYFNEFNIKKSVNLYINNH